MVLVQRNSGRLVTVRDWKGGGNVLLLPSHCRKCLVFFVTTNYKPLYVKENVWCPSLLQSITVPLIFSLQEMFGVLHYNQVTHGCAFTILLGTVSQTKFVMFRTLDGDRIIKASDKG